MVTPDRRAASDFSLIPPTGSTWPLMPPALLAKHVLAIGTRLVLGEGMSVLDVGATCGHALAILQARYRNKLRAMGVDGSKSSLQYARRTCQGTFCVGDARLLSGLADESFDEGSHIDTLLRKPTIARDLGEREGEGD